MSSNASFKIDALLVMGFGAGLHFFYKGFRTFREYRVLMDTPEIPIRSVAMGLVEIHGKATGVPPIPSPVTQTPCFFYKVDIEHWVQNKNGGSWSHIATDADGERFYLSDASGKVLVDAHQAEYDLVQTAKVETGRSSGLGLGRLFSGIGGPNQAALAPWPQSESDLWSYASAAVSRRKGAGIFGMGTGVGERYRLTEYLVVPEHWYDVTGTCVENPAPQDEQDRNMIVKGTNEPTFLITWRSEKEIRRTLRNRAAKYIFGGAVLAVFCFAIFLAKHGAF
jgi:hypothetical protein